MPGISQKGRAMPSSPIRKLVPFAEEAKRKGRKVYFLNIGQPDIKSPKSALEAVRNYSNDVIEYSHSAGNESYRRKLASHYQRHDVNVDHTEIMITTGASEAVSFALMATVNPGEEVICPEPFYANYNGFAAAAGVKVVSITANISNGFALPPMKEFEKVIGPKTKGIIICNPNNPTGYLYSEQEIRQLGEIVRKHDLYLYSDEVYREFCYSDEPYFSSMYLKGLENNVIMIDSVSKRYSMCGVRIGAIVTKNREVIDVAMKFAQSRLSPPSFGQIAGEAALDTPDSYFKEAYNEYLHRRNFIVDALNKIPGVICPMPGGAFYTVVELPVDDADKFCEWILSKFEFENQTVMMAPASGFYSSPGLGKKEVRIAYVLKKEDLEKAVIVLEEALKAYPGRTI